MTLSPDRKPFTQGFPESRDPAWRFRFWTEEEWNEIRPGCHPPGASRLGAVHVEIRCGDRDDRGTSVDPGEQALEGRSPMRERRPHPNGFRYHDVPVESIIVDPVMPGILAFLQHAILEGLIRTIPVGDGRVYLIPVCRGPRSASKGCT